jgi:integrase
MRRICNAPDASTLKGKRDRALLATLASSGLRCEEAATLTMQQVTARNGGYVVSVTGKGQAEPREAPLSVEAYTLIQAWLKARGDETGYIFTSFAGRSGKVLDKQMSHVAVWQVVQHYAQACELDHIKPHDFRRFVGTQLAASDIRKAQKALGHKDIRTTATHYVLDELEAGMTDNLY